MRRNLLSGYFKSFSIDSDFYPDLALCAKPRIPIGDYLTPENFNLSCLVILSTTAKLSVRNSLAPARRDLAGSLEL